MSILVNKDTRLVVQGITGREGAFHTQQMIDYGTNVVAGVTPGKGGEWAVGNTPVFDTVKKPWMPQAQIHRSSMCPHALHPMPSSRLPTPESN